MTGRVKACYCNNFSQYFSRDRVPVGGGFGVVWEYKVRNSKLLSTAITFLKEDLDLGIDIIQGGLAALFWLLRVRLGG